MSLLKKLFCLHQWVEWKEVPVEYEGEFSSGHYTVFHLKCTVCGKLKKIKSR